MKGEKETWCSDAKTFRGERSKKKAREKLEYKRGSGAATRPCRSNEARAPPEVVEQRREAVLDPEGRGRNAVVLRPQMGGGWHAQGKKTDHRQVAFL